MVKNGKDIYKNSPAILIFKRDHIIGTNNNINNRNSVQKILFFWNKSENKNRGLQFYLFLH